MELCAKKVECWQRALEGDYVRTLDLMQYFCGEGDTLAHSRKSRQSMILVT